MNTTDEEKKFFIKEKPVGFLVALRQSTDEAYVSLVCRKIDTTYAHACYLKSEFEELGLVVSEKSGRKNILQLTDRGKEIADQFIDTIDTFRQYEWPVKAEA